MTKPNTCKYCNSTDVPADLVSVRMCELCCSQSVDILFDGLTPLRAALLRRHLRRWRRATNGVDEHDQTMSLRPAAS